MRLPTHRTQSVSLFRRLERRSSIKRAMRARRVVIGFERVELSFEITGVPEWRSIEKLSPHRSDQPVRCEFLFTPEKGARKARDNGFASEAARAVASDGESQAAFVRRARDACGLRCSTP